MEIRPIAHIHTEFPEKFGIPRQSGLASGLLGTVVFEEGYRNPDALRGLEGFSHIWLLWGFSANTRAASSGAGRELAGNQTAESAPLHAWQPTVRPPRLGGNVRMGVFATRSPFRPNPIGLSCVGLEGISEDSSHGGPVLLVRGADLMDGTPIYDIKPYIRYADSRPDAVCGYVDGLDEERLQVVIPDRFLDNLSGTGHTQADMSGSTAVLSAGRLAALKEVLSLDPRPSYHDDPHRVYGMAFGDVDVSFTVFGNVLEVTDIVPLRKENVKKYK